MSHKLSLKICVATVLPKKRKKLGASAADIVEAVFCAKLSKKSELKTFVQQNFLNSDFLYSVC